jgi:hypothetical protein
MMNKALLLLMVLLVGCAGTADIDTNKVDSDCAHLCSANYSECLGKFTHYPLMAQRQCTDAMKLCVQAYPARRAVAASPASNASQRLANVEDLYKRRLISKEEYDAKRAEILKGL